MLSNINNALKKYNLRDLGGITTEDGRFLKNNQIFRSEHLVELDLGLLEEILSLYQIRTIIDLRTDEEVKKYQKYMKQLLSEINYYQLPLQCENIIVDINLKESRNYDGYEYLYYHLIKNESTVFRRGIEIVSNIKNRPILFHCIAGKDRTGIFAAILQLMLGISKEQIIIDYLKTPRSQEKNIKHLFCLIEEYGGIQGYTEYMGIDNGVIRQMKISLLY